MRGAAARSDGAPGEIPGTKEQKYSHGRGELGAQGETKSKAGSRAGQAHSYAD